MFKLILNVLIGLYILILANVTSYILSFLVALLHFNPTFHIKGSANEHVVVILDLGDRGEPSHFVQENTDQFAVNRL